MTRDRMTVREVAREYGVSERKVRPMTEAGEIPFQRREHYVHKDGTPGERYVYSRTQITAALRRAGELFAERSVA